MAEYTYKDVIIAPDDPRVEIGKEYYRADYPKKVLFLANNEEDYFGTLEEIDTESPETPFIIRTKNSLSPWACIIRKKEPKKKYVPFNLSKEEDRNFLRNKWVRKKDTDELWEDQILSFGSDEVLEEPYASLNMGSENAETLFKHFEFLDGTPCGRLVED